MNVLVLGATGGCGSAVISRLLAGGHTVTAFARDPAALDTARLLVASGTDAKVRLNVLRGDAMNADDVARAMPGHDAVVTALGNSQNPFLMKLGVRRSTSAMICETGNDNVMAAMSANGIRRLVIFSAFGVGETRDKVSFMFRMFFRFVLAEHMADKERMEASVKSSHADWTLLQPVALTNGPDTGTFASTRGEIDKPAVSRNDVARFAVDVLEAHKHLRETVTLSGSSA